jgi:hypothetical protein
VARDVRDVLDDQDADRAVAHDPYDTPRRATSTARSQPGASGSRS